MEETQSFPPPQLVPRKGYLDESQTGHFYVAKNRTFSLCLDTLYFKHVRNKRFQLPCRFLRFPFMPSRAYYSSGNRRKIIFNNLFSRVQIKDEQLLFGDINLNRFVPVFRRQLIPAGIYRYTGFLVDIPFLSASKRVFPEY